MKKNKIARRTLLGVMAGSFAAAATNSVAAGNVTLLSVQMPDGRSYEFDEAGLAALPWHTIKTETIWTAGLQEFRGPFLMDILRSAGWSIRELENLMLSMHALNDFSVKVPASDAWTYAPILARNWGGKPMQVRDKGPLWLVYPRSENRALQDPLMDERWIWQLRQILVE